MAERQQSICHAPSHALRNWRTRLGRLLPPPALERPRGGRQRFPKRPAQSWEGPERRGCQPNGHCKLILSIVHPFEHVRQQVIPLLEFQLRQDPAAKPSPEEEQRRGVKLLCPWAMPGATGQGPPRPRPGGLQRLGCVESQALKGKANGLPNRTFLESRRPPKYAALARCMASETGKAPDGRGALPAASAAPCSGRDGCGDSL